MRAFEHYIRKRTRGADVPSYAQFQARLEERNGALDQWGDLDLTHAGRLLCSRESYLSVA